MDVEEPNHVPAPSRRAAWLAWSMVGVALVVALSGVLAAGAWGEENLGHTMLYDVMWWAIALSWAVVGALIASRQPRNPIGWLFCGMTLFVALTAPAEAYEERYYAGNGGSQAIAELAAWFANWTWIPAVLVPLLYVPLYFPDGRLLSRRWRVVAYAGGLGIAGFAFSEAFAARELYGSEIQNPYGIDSVLVEIPGFGALLIVGAIVAAVVSVGIRFRRAEGIERQQIKWLAYAAGLAVTLLLSGGVGVVTGLWSDTVADALVLMGVLSLPAAVGLAILRYRLYDIDVLINRTLVYGGLTVGVLAIYVILVGGLAVIVQESADFWPALVATGLVALLVQPLRSTLQRRVNRLMYGDDAGSAGAGFRGRLHEAFVPEAAELQRARERLVAAREEERRRLRRDLHDGLGPTLAGAALKVEAAENLLATDPSKAEALLSDARSEIQTAVAEVRRLVYALRPPALDELGLVGALREQAEKLGMAEHPRVEIDAPDELGALPAAVEVAAYRISLEAMTNATRHADARTCVVRFALNGDLELEVVDDGRGLPEDFRAGVGLASMRERAEELGGTCDVERLDGRGTRVRARLPIGPA